MECIPVGVGVCECVSDPLVKATATSLGIWNGIRDWYSSWAIRAYQA